uniref:G domain-containing protein n=1 Tax=Desulfacinum infernum TaxID=35837 RepID=A0A832A0J8_9BACT
MGPWETSPTGVDDLGGRLRHLKTVLDAGSFLPLPEEERHALRRRAEELEEKLRQLEERTLLIGLVGGTGVGKSTLMNALAQEPIASVSHRRPHTDRVLLYRHVQCPLPRSLGAGEGLFTDVTHQADAVRHVIMADLPDFDSLVRNHRDRVIAFMEHLDLVLWVTTPEKYADARLYEMLRDAPKARENFAFVLNKADIFFPDSGTLGALDDLNTVVRSFRRLVREAGLRDSVLYVVSAQEVLEGKEASSWNQFPFLRRWVFQERDTKEIRAIKGANLDVAFHSLAGRLQEGMLQLEKAALFLEQLAAFAQDERRSADLTSVVRSVLVRMPGQGVFAHSLENPEDLQGSAALLSWLARLRASSPEPFQAASAFAGEVSAALEKRFRQYLEGIREHGAALAFQAGVSDPLRSELLERIHRSLENLSVAESAADAITIVLEQGRKIGEASRRWRQRLWSVLVTALLLLALGGQDGWRAVLAQPGPTNVVGLCAAMVEKLFSGTGLAALGTWAFLQVMLGARFYREYKKSLQRRSEAIIDSLQSALEGVLRRAVEDHLEVLRQCRHEMESRRDLVQQIVRAAPSKDRSD